MPDAPFLTQRSGASSIVTWTVCKIVQGTPIQHAVVTQHPGSRLIRRLTLVKAGLHPEGSHPLLSARLVS